MCAASVDGRLHVAQAQTGLEADPGAAAVDAMPLGWPRNGRHFRGPLGERYALLRECLHGRSRPPFSVRLAKPPK